MQLLLKITEKISDLPLEHLALLLALAVVGVAAFAIYVVHAVARERRRD